MCSLVRYFRDCLESGCPRAFGGFANGPCEFVCSNSIYNTSMNDSPRSFISYEFTFIRAEDLAGVGIFLDIFDDIN